MQKILLRSKNIFISIFLVIILILAAIALYYYKGEELFNKTRREGQEESNLEKTSVNESAIIDNKIVTKDKESVPLISAKSFLNYVNSLKPVSPESTSPKPSYEDTINTISYINYLLNVNLLVLNFLQEKSYLDQLKIIETLPASAFPADIKNIINDLRIYNKNYLLLKDNDKEIVFPKKPDWLKKFIKIEKKSPVKIEKEKSYTAISKKLEHFISFFYSENFMREFEK